MGLRKPTDEMSVIADIQASRDGVIYRLLTPQEAEELGRTLDVRCPSVSQSRKRSGMRRCSIRFIDADKLFDELRK